MTWLQAMNPNAPINSEADALKAGRASAISIFIGVIVGLVSAAWSFMKADDLAAQAAQGADPATAEVMAASVQAGLWMGVGLVVIQLILAVVQWRDPKKFIAILFIILIILGLLSTLATPMLAQSMPNMPATPLWQVALSVVIMVIQLVLHIAGLRGIKRLDEMQMAASR